MSFTAEMAQSKRPCDAFHLSCGRLGHAKQDSIARKPYKQVLRNNIETDLGLLRKLFSIKYKSNDHIADEYLTSSFG